MLKLKNVILEVKWFVFRVFVAYFFYKEIGHYDHSFKWCWDYSDCMDNFFDYAEWKSIKGDAQESVDEELSCWTE